MQNTVLKIAGLICFLVASPPSDAANWQSNKFQKTILNKRIEAKFQAGQLYQLTDRANGHVLLSTAPRDLPADIPLFGVTRVDLNACKVSQQQNAESLKVTFERPDGMNWTIEWSFDLASGDLVLRSSAESKTPVDEFRVCIGGCDIQRHTLVWNHCWGVGRTANAPWNETFLGDPLKDGSPMSFPHPLVALFQGKQSGWFIEGRDTRIGPACVMVKGGGDQATLGFVRRFPIPTVSPQMYEIRIRTYDKTWEAAVDPYVEWLEKGAGLIPIAKLPASQAWVQGITNQAYIDVGDFDGLEALAKRLIPEKTFLGREDGFRGLPMGMRYPDYHLTDVAKKWVKRARELGFHVGLHFNSNAVTRDFPDLVERFKPGFAVTGKDAKGNDTYESLMDGYFIRCSPAFKPWREYLIAQMKEAVACGVDVIYLDEGGGPSGKMVVDGVTGFEGLMLLMQEIRETYPHVAVETEQFNIVSAKHAKFALSQMPLGHPLCGYILQKYVKVVAEGVMYSPIDSELMDAFDAWGFMLPGADPNKEETWTKIAQAFQQFNLVADASLPHRQVTRFVSHWTGGAVPSDTEPVSAEGQKLFGFRGDSGVTAYLEKHPTQRGLVIYEPGKTPRWVGTRHYGITKWTGPGVVSYFGYRNYLKDWLIYDESSLLGLNPKVTYMFDETVTRSPDRFHVTKVPEDFVGYDDMERRIAPQEVGRDDTFFRLVFAGHGEMSMHVPDEYDVYLDGTKLEVDRTRKTANATISAAVPDAGSLGYFIQFAPEDSPAKTTRQKRPSMLLAFKQDDTVLVGKLPDLPWQQSKDTAKWVQKNDADGFITNVGAYVVFIGRFPEAKSIHMEGSYLASSFSGTPADGVVLINGKEAMRVPHGGMPYKPQQFNGDFAAYAGQHVIMELIPDGPVRAASGSWLRPKITATN